MTEQQINETIANNLFLIRNNTFKVIHGKKKYRKRLTQTDVGKSIGVTFQQMQKFEKGTNQVSSAKLKLLADFLKVPVQNLYKPIKSYYREIEYENSTDVVLDN
jgi:transcriptional regulator with XRE-family HTH domain